MENKIKLRIGQFDDKEIWLAKVAPILGLKNEDNEDLLIEHFPYSNHKKLSESIKKTEINFDYLILDIYDKDENIATHILNTIVASKLDLKVVLFSGITTKSGVIHEINYEKEKYPCLLSENIFPKSNIDKLIDFIIEDFLSNNTRPEYELLDKDDVLLNAEINSIGEQSFSLIIREIIQRLEIKTPIIIERMSSGFSGASVFKLHVNNKQHVLKASNQKEKLDAEIKNAKDYYLKLPSQLRIDIKSDNYGMNGTSAYLIENVAQGITLFEFLKSETDNHNIHEFFNYLFLESYCLKQFYKENITATDKYYKINDKFDSQIKIGQIKLTLKELSPIIQSLSESGYVDHELENSLLDYISDNKYQNIRPDVQKKNNVVVCHGDLHSRNIMLRNDDIKAPTIIDTGGMKEDFWCMDICRLLTNLFIEGIDQGTAVYFDINNIENQLAFAEKIITLDNEIVIQDDANKGFKSAIVWLIENIENIYEGMFTKWEFQLGLVKEFLQISYRKNSVPASKRTIALLAAYLSLKKANESIKDQ